MYQINRENGIVNRGNQSRLKNVMKRAENGEKLVIGFLGGSITQGSLATKPELCYAYRVFTWWKNQFPNAEFVYVNAGIGGTPSQLGAARVDDDLLAAKPDFVIVEFSVNDLSNEHFFETYEGVVRKVYYSETKPAVMLVHNVYYDSGANAQLFHSKVGRYYDLPSVSMQSSIYPEVLAGRIANRDITEDDLHPNDKGHELVASVITYMLEQVKTDIDTEEDAKDEILEPLTPNTYENCVRYRNDNCTPDGNSFVADTAEQNVITDCFKKGWILSQKGDKIIFGLEGTGMTVAYRRSVKHPAPIALAYINDDREHGVVLDANFDETWGDKLELTTIAEHLQSGKYTLTIELIEVHEDDTAPFYVVSVIEAH